MVRMVTEAKHTAASVAAESASGLRSIHYRMDHSSHPERAEALLAGANLIEGAADMLKALLLAKDDLERVAVDGDDFAATLAKINAAIAKATGEA